MVIRALEPRHHPAALALWRASEGVGLGTSDSRERFERFLARNPGTSFGAFRGAELVGTALCGHDGRRGYLHHLAVAPAHRGKGLGRDLVARCLDALAHEGIEKCHLFVFGGNADGLAFWARAGWTERTELRMWSRTVETR
jgi:ribosomal protein S18 acetylase RimI-like enzyme